MSDGSADVSAACAARDGAYTDPIETLNPAQAGLFQNDSMWPYFERLRKEDPVHWTPAGEFVAHWGITRFEDIMTVDTNHQVFSSEAGITLARSKQPMERMAAEAAGQRRRGMFSRPEGEEQDGPGGPSMFIAMDPPKHDEQRKTVSPAVSPHNLALMEPLIRERAAGILDSLPIGEPFDWVDKVSVELTTQMLATLFDFPFEERSKLTYWSDLITNPGAPPSNINPGADMTWDEMKGELLACAAYFKNLWDVR
ncbi:MAG: hypothetical protein ACREEW_18605, partial [Caulobacteraceae bacterium]